ncbi:hypothetical protein [Paludibaculum fermentans]|uniref:Uncharacterized protein n=1 Tax=Paludibaculum fermentans TaxID=1473598 RepID=A0A7S7SHV6_PALFE|nr:hypothetical protein [Paludibaculum fermentans]QOY85389.1 hypothetical protein IRI77_21450 [Paludibaculum fermentans]
MRVLSRRRTIATLGASLIPSALAAPPWQTRPVEQWSEKELQRVVTDSPWAVRVSVPLTGPDGPTPGRSGSAPGLPYGRSAGAGMPMPVEHEIPFLVRWDSAKPVREALKRLNLAYPEVDEKQEGRIYVITILPGETLLSTGHIIQPEGETRKRILTSTVLRRRGQPEIHPFSVKGHYDGPALFTYFFQPAIRFAPDDGAVEFSTIAPRPLSCKFKLTEMVYEGQLAL